MTVILEEKRRRREEALRHPNWRPVGDPRYPNIDRTPFDRAAAEHEARMADGWRAADPSSSFGGDSSYLGRLSLPPGYMSRNAAPDTAITRTTKTRTLDDFEKLFKQNAEKEWLSERANPCLLDSSQINKVITSFYCNLCCYLFEIRRKPPSCHN